MDGCKTSNCKRLGGLNRLGIVAVMAMLLVSTLPGSIGFELYSDSATDNGTTDDDGLAVMPALDLKYDSPAKLKVGGLLNEFQMQFDIEECVLGSDTFGNKVSKITVWDCTAPSKYYVAETDDGRTFELSTEFNEYLADNMGVIACEDDAVQAVESFIRYGFPMHFRDPLFLRSEAEIPSGDAKDIADYGLADEPYVIDSPTAVLDGNGYKVELYTWYEADGAIVKWSVDIDNSEVTHYNWHVLDEYRGEYVRTDLSGFQPYVGLRSGGNLKFGGDLRKWSGDEPTQRGPRVPNIAVNRRETFIRENHSDGAITADTVRITCTGFNPHTRVNLSLTVWAYPYSARIYKKIYLGIHQADATGRMEYDYKPLDHPVYSGTADIKAKNSTDASEKDSYPDLYITEVYQGEIEGKKYHVYYRDGCFGFDRAKALTFAREMLQATFNAYNTQEKVWNFRSRDPDVRKIFVNDGTNKPSAVYELTQHGVGDNCQGGNDVQINIDANLVAHMRAKGMEYSSQQETLNVIFGHEMLHNYQYGIYQWKGGKAWDWLTEGTAQGSQTWLYPAAEHQARSMFYNTNIMSGQDYVDYPDQPLANRTYGCSPLWGYIYGKDGGIATIKSMLEERKNRGDALPKDGETMVDNVLAAAAGAHDKFEEVYKDFIVDLYKKDLNWAGKNWGAHLHDAKTTNTNYPGGYKKITRDGGRGEWPARTARADAYAYGIDYHKITFTKRVEKFSVTVKWTDTKNEGHIAVLIGAQDPQYLGWDATDKEYGPLTIDNAWAITEIVVAVTNYDTDTARRNYEIILTSPMIESVDNTGTKLDEFWTGDKVYAKGSGFPADRQVDLYVIESQLLTNGTSLAGKNVEDDAIDTVTTNAQGEIATTLVWQTKTEDRDGDDIADDVGYYDIVADVNPTAREPSLGIYDKETDTVDEIIGAGFYVKEPYVIVLIFGVVEGGEYEEATVTWRTLSQVDGGPAQTEIASHPSPTTFKTEGRYTVKVKAIDSLGNTEQKMVNFTIKKEDGAGGDHPDDSFDIANEYVLTEDILDAYVRQAKKKNLTGILWYKEFLDAMEDFENNASALDNGSRRAAWRDLLMLSRRFLTNEEKIEADFAAAPDVAVLDAGFSSTARAFLTTFNEPSVLVPIDFSPTIAEVNPVLLIPSGGLYGLENSALFKLRLRQYCELGGTIITMAQQHGYEFSALPDDITGYGWREDQSCLYAATYMDTYNAILSSQTRATPNINVDGFFTGVPDGATVLMRRTKNSMPAVICYNYSNGRVVASNAYTDWAYGRSAETTDGKNLLRESINWARFNTPITEYGTSDAIAINITLTNGGSSTATAVRFRFMNPDHELAYTAQSSISLTAGSSTVVTAEHSAISTLGIWGIDYELLDANDNVIYTGYDAARFSISKYTENPNGFAYEGTKLAFTITTPDESATRGSDVTFTVHIWNNDDHAYNVRCKLRFIRHANPPEFIIPVEAGEEATYPYTLYNVNAYRIDLWAYFYDNDTGSHLGGAAKVVKMFSASVDIEVTPERSLYGGNDTVRFNVKATNRLSATYATTVKVRVTDPLNSQVYYNESVVNLSANGMDSRTHDFPLGATPVQGAYTISVGTYDDDGDKIGFSSANFEVPAVMVGLEYELPESLAANTPIPLNITVTNIGTIPAAGCTLNIQFTAPNGTALWTNTTEFNLSGTEARAEQDSAQFSVPAGDLHIGDYKFDYTLTYDSKIMKGLIVLPASMDVKTEFNRASYRAYDTFIYNVTLENTGRFELPASVTTTITTFDLSESENATLATSGADKTKTLSFTYTVPSNISWGKHAATVQVKIDGTATTETSYFYVEPSELTYTGDIPSEITRAPYTSSYVLTIPIENTGGVDTVCNLTVVLYDSYSFKVAESNENFSVVVGTTVARNFTIPQALVGGKYFLYIKYTDESTMLEDSVWEEILIDGFNATLTVITNKTLYSTSVLHSEEEEAVIIDDPVTNESVYKGVSINNTYLDIAAGWRSYDDGRFTIGTNLGDPNNPNDDGKRLIYGWPRAGSTSFTTIRVDGEDYKFGNSYTGHSTLISPTHLENDSLITIWEYDHIIVKQILSFTHSETGRPDLVDIRYELYNNDSIEHQVGVRVYIDTMLGYNDGAPFRVPGIGEIIYETDFVGDFVPDYWICMDDIESPDVVSRGILRAGGAAVPDRFVTARYGNIYGTTWDFEVDEDDLVTYDSAIGIWWDPTELAPLGSRGASRTINTFYGIGSLETYAQQGPIATLIQAPYVVSVDPDSPYPELEVRVFLKNTGYDTAEHVAAAIELPEGLRLQLGESAVQVLGDLEAQEEIQITWNLRVTGEQIGWINYIINVSGLNIENTVVIRHVYVPRELILFGTLLYETNISIASLAELGTQDIIELIAGLNSSGKHYILATLLTPLGQAVAQNHTYFFVANASVGVEFGTDKELYLPNEEILVSGQLVSFAGASRTVNLTARSESNDTVIYSEQFALDAHGSSTFSFTTSATASFVLAIELDVIGEDLFIITSAVKVENPSLDVTLRARTIVGREPFDMVTILRNTGNIAFDIEFVLQDTELNVYGEGSYHLVPGASELIHTTIQIEDDTTFQAVITGDVEMVEELYIVQAEKAEITFPEFNIYPLGEVTVPLAFVNTGLATLEFDADVNVYAKADYESNGATVRAARALTSLYTTSLTIYLPADESVTHELDVDVPEGEYMMTVSCTYFSATFEFEVIDGIAKFTFDSVVYEWYYYDLIFKVNVTNIEDHDIVGDVVVRAEFYTDTIDFELEPQETLTDTTYIVLPEIEGGTYEVTLELRQNGLVVQQATFYVAIPSASFEVTLYNLDDTYELNGTMSPSFYVRNTGLAAGEAALRVNLPGIHDETQTAWIEPGSYEYFTFEITVPDDLVEGTYEFNYEVGGVSYNTTYYVYGVELDVAARLDKTLYAATDTAVLTITVFKNTSASYSLYSRVQFDGYEERQYFNMTADTTQTNLTFDIPVAFTGERIFYSVYSSTGRAVYINSIAIHSTNLATVGVEIHTDKDRYSIGDDVTIHINAIKSGHLSLELFDEQYDTDIIVVDTQTNLTHTISVPMLPTGTYYIRYSYSGSDFSYNLTYGLEVDGIKAIVLESNASALRLDNETLSVELTLSVEFNRNATGYIDIGVYDPEDFRLMQLRYPPYESSTIEGARATATFQFTVGINEFSIPMECSSAYSGTYRVSYQLVANNETGEPLDLVKDSEYFDVAGAVIIGASTDIVSYESGKPIRLEVATYDALGTQISIELDGIEVATTEVPSDSYTTHTFTLSGQDEVGTHTLTISLSSDDDVTSSRELAFFVGAVNHAPSLSSAGVTPTSVSPTSGGMNTEFNFTVTYTDADNDRPYYVVLVLTPAEPGLDVITLNMYELCPADLDTTDGNVYYVTHTFTELGNYTYAFKCIDGVDRFELDQYNADPASEFLTIVLADLPPADVSIIVESTTVSINEDIEFTTNAYDPDGLPLTYHWDFGDGITATDRTVTHSYTEAGNYTVTLTVEDSVGLEVAVTQIITVLDLPPADVSIIVESTTVSINEDIEFTTNAYDPDGLPLTYLWDFGDNSTATDRTVTHIYTELGNYTVTLTVEDNVGHEVTVTQVITVVDLPPTDVSIIVESTTVDVNEDVEFTTNAYDPEGLSLTYLWDFGDDVTASNQTVTHSYTEAGNYTVTLTVEDSYGHEVTVTQAITVVLDLPPADVSIIVESTTVDVNEDVEFTTNAYDPEGLSLTYLWDFGDNNTATSRNVTHRYAATGTYTVTLTVTDQMGHETSATTQITVTEEAVTEPGPTPSEEWDSLYTIVIIIVIAIIVSLLVVLLFMKKRKEKPGTMPPSPPQG